MAYFQGDGKSPPVSDILSMRVMNGATVDAHALNALWVVFVLGFTFGIITCISIMGCVCSNVYFQYHFMHCGLCLF